MFHVVICSMETYRHYHLDSRDAWFQLTLKIAQLLTEDDIPFKGVTLQSQSPVLQVPGSQ
jgi:hypothetical protein